MKNRNDDNSFKCLSISDLGTIILAGVADKINSEMPPRLLMQIIADNSC